MKMKNEQIIPEHYIQSRKVKLTDIGAKVTYVPRHAKGNTQHLDCERGTIKAIGRNGIHVAYGTRNICLTCPSSLHWGW